MEEIKIDYANMSIYKKIQVVKKKILEANLKKTGQNKYAGFNYYELSDFVPTIINLCNEVGLFTKFSYDNEMATLTIINSDNVDQKEVYTSPMRVLELKGCNQIQALGGVETYSRRYLYMSAFDIIENDMFDGTKPEEVKPKAPQNPPQVQKATETQIAKIKEIFTEEEQRKALSMVKKEKIEDLTIQEASSLISKKQPKGGITNE